MNIDYTKKPAQMFTTLVVSVKFLIHLFNSINY